MKADIICALKGTGDDVLGGGEEVTGLGGVGAEGGVGSGVVILGGGGDEVMEGLEARCGAKYSGVVGHLSLEGVAKVDGLVFGDTD